MLPCRNVESTRRDGRGDLDTPMCALLRRIQLQLKVEVGGFLAVAAWMTILETESINVRFVQKTVVAPPVDVLWMMTQMTVAVTPGVYVMTEALVLASQGKT